MNAPQFWQVCPDLPKYHFDFYTTQHKRYLNKIAGANFFKFKYTDLWMPSRGIYILTPRLCLKRHLGSKAWELWFGKCQGHNENPRFNAKDEPYSINSLPNVSHSIQDSMSRLRSQVRKKSCFFLAWKNGMPSQLISWCECLCFSLPVRLLLICRILWQIWAIYSQPKIAFTLPASEHPFRRAWSPEETI